MRILILNPEFPPLGGGAANATAYLLRELSAYKNLSVDLITASVDCERTEQLAENVTLHFLDIKKEGSLHYYTNRQLLRYSNLALVKARQLHAKKPYDLVHAFFGIPSGVIARRLGAPYIVSLRGSDVPFYNPRYRWHDRLLFKHLSKQIWKKSAAVVANSQQLAQLARRTSKSIEIPVIQNGVDVDEFQPSETEPPTTPFRIICVSRLIKRKGIDRLIDAVADISSSHPQLTLELAGDGNIRKELEDQAADRGIRDRVNFLGPIEHDKLVEIYQQSHLFVLPSRNEGMSNTALEALACGLPLILTDTGGANELTKGNGATVPVDDQAALNAAILNILNNDELRGNYRSQSRQKALTYSWAAMAQQYLKLYRTIQFRAQQ